ncbi:MAG: hypothetical protein ACXWPM_00590 [Bdellovibrionota bacterium]
MKKTKTLLAFASLLLLLEACASSPSGLPSGGAPTGASNPSVATPAAESSPLPQVLLGTKRGLYAEQILRLYARFKQGQIKLKPFSGEPTVIESQAVPTPGKDTYVGILARQRIHASIPKVIAALENTAKYTEIYSDLKRFRVVEREGPETTTDWTLEGPMGFKSRYRTTQRLETIGSSHGSKIYGLKSSPDLRESDGFIFLQQDGDYTNWVSIDFVLGDWGAMNAIFRGTVWETSCLTTARAAASFRLLAEGQTLDLQSAKDFDVGHTSQLCELMSARKKQKPFDEVIWDVFEDKAKASK